LIKLGTSYNNYTVPIDMFDSNSVCYFAGVGEDFIFDCVFIKKVLCRGFLIDPTPRSKIHFENVKKVPETSPIPKSEDYQNYVQFRDILDFFTYCDFGLYAKSEVLQFYPPSSPGAVSHSVDNIKNTNSEFGFKAQCYTLKDTMKLLGHDKIDFLKMNIEGSEIYILHEIVREKIPVRVLAVDFDYLKKYTSPTLEETLTLLKTAGFELVFGKNNFTFINRNWEKI
jgi:hypothetical protein